MTQRFKDLLPFIFEHECVFAKGHYGDYKFVVAEEVKGDRGGITKWGCDIREFGKSPFNLSVDDIRNLTMDKATNLYWRNWNRFHVEDMKYPLGEAWFNCKIVSGKKQADLILNRTSQDAAKFIKDQEKVNLLIVKANPTDQKFLAGWQNRLAELRKFLHIQSS